MIMSAGAVSIIPSVVYHDHVGQSGAPRTTKSLLRTPHPVVYDANPMHGGECGG